MKKIKLNKNHIDYLSQYPESGMGYQNVDIVLKNGNTLTDMKVLNSEYLILNNNEKFISDDIETIKIKEETILYEDLLKEEKGNKYSIPEITWLYFLCFMYGGKMEKSAWDHDNRVGVNYKDTMLKFLNNNIIKTDNKYYYCTDKGKNIVLDVFYHEDFKDTLNAKHKFEQYDISGYNGYPISKIPYELWLKLNPSVKEEFEKLNNLHTDYWNSDPEGMGDPKYLDQMLKNPYIDLYNYKNLFYYFYPNKVPDIITLYRGIKEEYDIKFQEREFSSWTLNKKQAERFSKYHFVSLAISGPQESEKQTILKTEIPIKDIDIVIGGNEAEVILKNPVKNVDVENIKEETILYENINNKNIITKISIFDFDGTLIETELPEPGKKIWKEKTGKDWPYKGWWGRIESLSSIFDNNINSQVHEGYKKSIKEFNSLTVLITGRLKNIFEDRVKELLKEKGLDKFDEYYFNTGGNTFDLKIQQIESLLKKYPQVTNVEMWEDRPKHIEGFKEWFKTKNNIELKINFINTGHYTIKEEKNNNIINEMNTLAYKIKDIDKEELFKKLSKALNIKVSTKNFIDSGGFGFVYEVNDKLLMKLTFDVEEAEAINKIVGKKLNTIVNYYNIFKLVSKKILHDVNIFVILMERVETDELYFKTLIDDLNDVLLTKNIDWYDINTYLRKYAFGKKDEYMKYIEKLIDNYEIEEVGDNAMEIYSFLFDAYSEANKYGLSLTDIHERNMGIKNGDFVIFDLSAKGGLEVKKKLTIKEENINKKFIKWKDLKDREKEDIIESIYYNSEYLQNDWNIWTFQDNIDDLIDLSVPLKIMSVDDMWEDSLKQNRGYSEVNIERLKDIFYEEGELDPVLVKDNEFFDGGHRLRIYKENGMEKIPAYDIGFLLRTDWKKWLEEDGEMAKIINENKIMNYNDLLKEQQLLTEDRISDAKKKYSYLSIEWIKVFIDMDPSGNQKYLDWLLKTFDKKPAGTVPKEIEDIILYFHKNTHKYKKKDINQYKSFDELKQATEEAKQKLTKGEIERMAKQETNVLLNDNDYFVVIPKSHRASCYYGAGTRWCTTEKDPMQFESTSKQGHFLYVIDKHKKPFIPKEKTTGSVGPGKGDKSYKVAILINKDSDNIDIWLANDDKIDNVKSYFKNNPKINQILSQNNLLTFKQKIKYDLISKKELDQFYKEQAKLPSLAGRLIRYVKLRQTKGEIIAKQIFSEEEIALFNGRIEFNDDNIILNLESDVWEKYYSGLDENDIFFYNLIYSDEGFRDEFDKDELNYVYGYLNDIAIEKVEYLMKLYSRDDLIKDIREEKVIADFIESLPEGENKFYPVLWAINDAAQEHLQGEMKKAYEGEAKFESNYSYGNMEIILPYDKLIYFLLDKKDIKSLADLEIAELNGEIRLDNIYSDLRGQTYNSGIENISEKMIDIIDHYIEILEEKPEYIENYNKFQQIIKDLKFDENWKLYDKKRKLAFKILSPDYLDGKVTIKKGIVNKKNEVIKTTEHKIPIDSLGSFVTVGTLFENKNIINYNDLLKEENNNINEFMIGRAIKSLPELNEMEFVNKITKKLNLPQISIKDKLGSGEFGNAYIVEDKVLKITSQKREAVIANKLIGKNLKYVANYYDVFKLQSKEISNVDLWVILLEKLDKQNIKISDFIKMENMLEGEIGLYSDNNDAIQELEKYAKKYNENKEIIEEIRQHILTEHSKDKNMLKFFDFIINVHTELIQYGIDWFDLHLGNIGLRNNELVGFDIASDIGGQIIKKRLKLKETINYNNFLQKYWYHGTTDINLAKKGFGKSKDGIFGPGLYLAPNIKEARYFGFWTLKVYPKIQNVFVFDYNDLKSKNEVIKILNVSLKDKEIIDNWGTYFLPNKLKTLGYDALYVKIDFNKLSKKEKEIDDLTSYFGTEEQLIVFNPLDVKIISLIKENKIINYNDLLKENNREEALKQFKKESDMKIWFYENVVDKVKEIINPEYPDYISYIDENTEYVYMKYNKKRGFLFVDYDKIWSIFESKYSYNSKEIRRVIENFMAEYYGLKNVTPGMSEQWLLRSIFNIKKIEENIINEQKDLIPDDWKSQFQIEGNNIILYHYGPQELKDNYLDPKYFGQKSYTSDVKQWGQKRLFFYIKPEDKEWRVTGKEYIVKYPLNKLYPFNKDPLDFYEKCLEEYNVKDLSVNIQVICIGNKAKENGFSGMISRWENSFRVDIWEKIYVGEQNIKENKIINYNDLLSEQNNDKNKLYNLVNKFRTEQEKYYEWEKDKICFKGKCSSISKELGKYLKNYGYNVHITFGEYCGASWEYVPNMEQWEDWEVEEYNQMFEVGGPEDMCYAHWWIVVNGKYIVDITSDQFHPEEENEYRVIITDITDSNYQGGSINEGNKFINYNDLLNEQYNQSEMVSVIVKINNNKGIAIGEIFNKDKNSLIIVDRYYSTLNSYDVEVGHLSGKEQIIELIYDNGELFDETSKGVQIAEQEEYKDYRIVYHITTEENLPNILKTGLEPKKSKPDVYGKKYIITFINKESFIDTIKRPFWLFRKTKGYVLLTIKLPKSFKTNDGYNQTPLFQINVFDFIPSKYIINVQKIGKIKLKITDKLISTKYDLVVYLIDLKKQKIKDLVIEPHYKEYYIEIKNIEKYDEYETIIPKEIKNVIGKYVKTPQDWLDRSELYKWKELKNKLKDIGFKEVKPILNEEFIFEQNKFQELFNQIKNKKYQDISQEMWNDLQYEGWLDELEDMFKIEINSSEQLEYIKLDISKEDYEGLISSDNNIVNKYTKFDLQLKNSGLYDKGYLDFIDYDEGIIYIMRIKRNLIKENINLLKEKEQLNFFEVGDYTVGSDWVKEEFLNRLSKKLKIKIKKYINSGVFGNAYEIEGNKVLKITTDKEEAEAVNRLVNKNLKYVVKYYYVGKIQSSKLTLENHDLYVILMEKVNDANRKFFQDMHSITNKLEHNNINIYGTLIAEKIMWGEFKLIDDKLFISHDEIDYEIDLNIFDKNGKELFNFMFNLYNELKKYGLLYSDLHGRNVGIKNGKFIAFDIASEIGGLEVKKKLHIKEENKILKEDNKISKPLKLKYKMVDWFLDNILPKLEKKESVSFISYDDKNIKLTYLEYDKIDNGLMVSYNEIWKYFEHNYSNKDKDIEDLIEFIATEHLSLWGIKYAFPTPDKYEKMLVGSSDDILQEENNSSLCFQYPSDEIRYNLIKDELKNPDNIWNDEEFYNESDLQEIEWLTKVLNKRDYLDYYELFVDDCWINLFNKSEYKNLSKTEAIQKLVNERFVKIGNSLNLKIKDWSFEDNILNIHFYKKNNNHPISEEEIFDAHKWLETKNKIQDIFLEILDTLKKEETKNTIIWEDKDNNLYFDYDKSVNLLYIDKGIMTEFFHIINKSGFEKIELDKIIKQYLASEFLDIQPRLVLSGYWYQNYLQRYKIKENKIINYNDLLKEDLGTFGSNLVPSTGNDNPVEFSHRMLGKTKGFNYDKDNTINYNRLMEFSHGILNARIGDIPGNIPLKIAKKLGYKQAKYLDTGQWGNIYDIGLPDKLMKITMDKDESETSFKLIGKELKNVVNFYNVYSLDLSKYKEKQPFLKLENLFVIIMDKVDFNKEENLKLDHKLDDTIQRYHYDNPKITTTNNLNMLIRKLRDNPYFVDKGLEQYIKYVGTDIYEYYQFIISLVRELIKYGITYGDIHPGNFGRKNGKLVSFDMGVSTGGKKVKSSIEIDENNMELV